MSWRVLVKGLKTLIPAEHSPHKCLPFALAAMAFLITGCPHNEYIVELKPRGNLIERTLVFYREDGANTKAGTTNYHAFEAKELAAITALYPAHRLTNAGNRYTVRGEFSNELPGDVGGAGLFTNLTTCLGSAGFYLERFRGNDDLVSMAERRFKAADQLADLCVGWSQMELGRKPGYDKLRKFLDGDLRRDLKNLGSYCLEMQLVSDYKTNATEEFCVRLGQYFFERGYFRIGEIADLSRDVSSGDSQAVPRQIQRLLARKMGVPESKSMPAWITFLADETMMQKSLDKYLAGTKLYRAKLKQWKQDQKLKPDTKKPEPSEVVNEVVGNLVEFNAQPDHLAVHLSLPSPPVHSNGRWDGALKQVVWEADIVARTNKARLPVSCYASWAQADEEFQKAHFGKTSLTGDDLTQYCLWRSGLDMQHGAEWDTFLSGLQPGGELTDRIESFRFSGESEQVGTNGQQQIPSTSYPRELLSTALSGSKVVEEALQHLMKPRVTKQN